MGNEVKGTVDRKESDANRQRRNHTDCDESSHYFHDTALTKVVHLCGVHKQAPVPLTRVYSLCYSRVNKIREVAHESIPILSP